jgi:phosphatidate cytidylyltransferase
MVFLCHVDFQPDSVYGRIDCHCFHSGIKIECKRNLLDDEKERKDRMIIFFNQLLSAYFLIGGIAVILIIRKKKNREESIRLITKYFFYLAIVAGMVIAILNNVLKWVAIAFVVIGLIEMIIAGLKIPSERRYKMFIGLFCYGIVAYVFLYFSFRTELYGLMRIYTLVVVFDGFSQITGQLIGKTKLLPKISPGKTWEGFAGGFFFVFLSSVLIEKFRSARVIPGQAMELSAMVHFNWGYILLFAVSFSIIALLGDLLSSFYKRICGIKDFGNWIPGHGGLLDRFDSFMFVGCCLGMVMLVIDQMT